MGVIGSGAAAAAGTTIVRTRSGGSAARGSSSAINLSTSRRDLPRMRDTIASAFSGVRNFATIDTVLKLTSPDSSIPYSAGIRATQRAVRMRRTVAGSERRRCTVQ